MGVEKKRREPRFRVKPAEKPETTAMQAIAKLAVKMATTWRMRPASPATLSSLKKVVSEMVATGLRDLKSEIKKELSQVRTSFKEDMKMQVDGLTTEIIQQVSAATGKIGEVVEQLGEIEKNMTWKES